MKAIMKTIELIVVTIAFLIVVSACTTNKSRTVYNGRYVIEKENEAVERVTDLKTNKIKWKIDGDETKWFDSETTWEEACTTWDDI